MCKRMLGTSGELKLVSKRSEDREALPWSMTGGLGIAIYGFNTPTSDRGHLSFCPTNCPGKTKLYIKSKWKCRIQQQEKTRNRSWGKFSFWSKTLLNWFENYKKKKTHFYNTHSTYMQLNPQIPVNTKHLSFSVIKYAKPVLIFLLKLKQVWKCTAQCKIRMNYNTQISTQLGGV